MAKQLQGIQSLIPGRRHTQYSWICQCQTIFAAIGTCEGKAGCTGSNKYPEFSYSSAHYSRSQWPQFLPFQTLWRHWLGFPRRWLVSSRCQDMFWWRLAVCAFTLKKKLIYSHLWDDRCSPGISLSTSEMIGIFWPNTIFASQQLFTLFHGKFYFEPEWQAWLKDIYRDRFSAFAHTITGAAFTSMRKQFFWQWLLV